MLIIMLIVIVLFGFAYADYCLVDNTEHFGICFGKIAEAEAARESELLADAARESELLADAIEAVPPAVFAEDDAIEGEWAADSGTSPSDREQEALLDPPPGPAPAWLLLDLEPVLELHEG